MKSNFFAAGYYYQYFKEFNFPKLHSEFKLIEDNDSQQLFIPIKIPIPFFDNISNLEKMRVLTEDKEYVDGTKVFEYYEKLINLEFDDFSMKKIELKRLVPSCHSLVFPFIGSNSKLLQTCLTPKKANMVFNIY